MCVTICKYDGKNSDTESKHTFTWLKDNSGVYLDWEAKVQGTFVPGTSAEVLGIKATAKA